MVRTFIISALLLIMLLVSPMVRAARVQAFQPNDPETDDLWIDVSIGPEFIDWINSTVRAEDIVRIDHMQMLPLLDDIQRGRRLVIVKTIDEAEQLLPQLAGEIDIIGYNLEHGPANDPREQAAPVASVRRMRELADEYGVQLAVGPDRAFALSDGVAMATFADIMILQVQKVQEDPATVINFVAPLAQAMRAANPNVQIGMQIGAQGDVDQVTELTRQLAPVLDGVSILTDHASVEFTEKFVAALRPDDRIALTPTVTTNAATAVASPQATLSPTTLPAAEATVQQLTPAAEATTQPLALSAEVTVQLLALSAPTASADTVAAPNTATSVDSAAMIHSWALVSLIILGAGIVLTLLLYYVLPGSK